MRSVLIACATLAASVLAGCNGEVRSKLWTVDALQKEMSEKEGVKGVFGYYTKSVVEVDLLTLLVDKDGNATGKPCAPIEMRKMVTLADYDHPVQIWYEPGLLEANKFGVQYSNSVFTAVNSESTPDQGKTLANLASAATSFAKFGAAVAEAPPTAPGVYCNSGASSVRFEALPKLP